MIDPINPKKVYIVYYHTDYDNGWKDKEFGKGNFFLHIGNEYAPAQSSSNLMFPSIEDAKIGLVEFLERRKQRRNFGISTLPDGYINGKFRDLKGKWIIKGIPNPYYDERGPYQGIKFNLIERKKKSIKSKPKRKCRCK